MNIETGIVLREMLGARLTARANRSDVPLVLRVYDRALGSAVAQRFGFENVRSTVELAAPWFIGAAMGLQVLGTFSVGQHSFMVGAMQVARRQRARWHADARAVDPNPRHRDHSAGRAGHTASAAGRPTAGRRHRLPRRPVPRAAGTFARVRHRSSRPANRRRRQRVKRSSAAATSAAAPQLLDVGTGWDQLDLVGADRPRTCAAPRSARLRCRPSR